jgi:capsular polysaccharide biosynthesis protein
VQPKEYAAAIGRRWVWISACGIAGALFGAALSSSTAPTYTSSTSLLVGVERVGADENLALASRIGTQVLPSLERLARSPAVLSPVATTLREAGAPAGGLASRITADVAEGTSVLVVTAEDDTPEGASRLAAATGAELQRAAARFHGTDGDADVLRLTTVAPATAPAFPSAPETKRSTAAGMLAGVLVGVLATGAGEIARPRVRDAGDVAGRSGLSVLGTLPPRTPGRRARLERATAVHRLAALLHPGRAQGRSIRRTALVGPPPVTGRLARELRAATSHGLDPVHVPAPTDLDAATVEAAVLVVDAHRTPRRALDRAVAAAQDSPVPLAGVVLDGVLTERAGLLARIVSAVQGRARLGSVLSETRPGPPDRPLASTRAVAVVALVAVGLAHPLPAATNTALAVAVLLAPVWVGSLQRFRGGTLIAALTGIGLLSGLLLARWSSADHAFAPREALETSFAVMTGLGIVGVVLWARTVLPLPVIGCAYGVGAVVTGLLRMPGSENAWKFELALPLTIVALSWAAMASSRLPTVFALAVLGVLDVLNDARSAFGFCVLAAVLVLWQTRPAGAERGSRWAPVLLMGGLGVGGYLAISELLLAGALGSEVQARTATQVAQSGSLLLGGRPEWSATWALMRENPLGFGLGTVPSTGDVAVAEEGLAVANIPTGEGYLRNYLLADRFELHSVVADLWTHLGPAGLLLGLVMAVLLVRGLADRLAHREASGLLCFLPLIALWYLAFGPLPSNLPEVGLAVALVLLPRIPVRPRAASPARPPAGRTFAGVYR